MKKNNRGFLLAESLVVSTFVLTVLILLYIQFNNLTTNYKNSYNYNNVESIYDLSSVSDYLLNNNYNLSNQLTASKPYVVVYKNGSCNMDAGIIDTFCDNLINKMDAKTVIYTSSDISIIQKYVSEKGDSNINQKLREFISRVETNTVQNKGRLFAEFNNGTFATIAMDNTVGLSDGDSSGPSLSSCGNSYFGNASNPIVTSGSGLYADTYESGKCIYKGANPNNYITFNNELWRIISVESDGTIKIIRNELLEKRAFDSEGARATGYCLIENGGAVVPAYGCNAWTADNKYVNGNRSGIVSKDAEINTYLNGEYYNGITSNKDKIVSHNFNAGGVSNNEDLASQINSEKTYQWNGKIGLISLSEYIRANSNQTSCGTISLTNSNYSTCKTTNWMYISESYWWTLSPYANYADAGWIVDNHGRLSSLNSGSSYHIRPVFYLSSSVTLTGSGTKINPFKIS